MSVDITNRAARADLESGYIYILINSSMENLIKIGKTSRDPEKRVVELSSATGVPTPFTLVYKEYFNDCNSAENVIHKILEEKGHRVSNNREFFNIPVHQAITLIQEVKASLGSNISNESIHHSGNNKVSDNSVSLIQDGEDYLEGHGSKLQNPKKGIELLLKAAKLADFGNGSLNKKENTSLINKLKRIFSK